MGLAGSWRLSALGLGTTAQCWQDEAHSLHAVFFAICFPAVLLESPAQSPALHPLMWESTKYQVQKKPLQKSTFPPDDKFCVCCICRQTASPFRLSPAHRTLPAFSTHYQLSPFTLPSHCSAAPLGFQGRILARQQVRKAKHDFAGPPGLLNLCLHHVHCMGNI